MGARNTLGTRDMRGAVVAAALACNAAVAAPLTDVSGITGIFDKVLMVQPISVCQTNGTNCAMPALFADDTIRALGQASIATVLLKPNVVHNTALNQITWPREYEFLLGPNLGQSRNVQTTNAWFVNGIAVSDSYDERGNYVPAHRPYGFGFIPEAAHGISPNGSYIVSSKVTKDEQRTVLAHELGHQLGLQHVAGPADNLMSDGATRNKDASALTRDQIEYMRQSKFLAHVPNIHLITDTVAGTNLPGNSTEVRIEYRPRAGTGDVALRELSINLADFIDVQGVPSQRPATAQSWLSLVDTSLATPVSLSYRENMVISWPCRSCGDEFEVSSTNGAPEILINFGEHGLLPGDFLTFRFGVTMNLRNEYEYVVERDLLGAAVDLHFDHGLSAQTLLIEDSPAAFTRMALLGDGAALTGSASDFDLRRFTGIYQEGRYNNPFGAQYGVGEVAPWDGAHLQIFRDHGSATAVPLPATWALLLLGLLCSLALPRASRAAPTLTDVSGVGGLFQHVLMVQPIMVCNAAGDTCGRSSALYPETTIRTLAQAHIATALLPLRHLTNDALAVIELPADRPVLAQSNIGQSSNVQTVNTWLTRAIYDHDELNAAGEPLRALGMVTGFAEPQGSTSPNGVLQGWVSNPRKAITFAHELGHTLGLRHVDNDPDNLMASGTNSNFQPNLSAAQIATMKTSGFLAAVPHITLSTRTVGSEGARGTELRIEYVQTPGSADAALRELSIDLRDLWLNQGPPGQLPATAHASMRVVDSSSIGQPFTVSYGENMFTSWPCISCDGEPPGFSSTNGLPELALDFGEYGLQPGQFLTLQLGITTNLRNEYEYTEGRSLSGAAVDLHFEHGLSAQVLLQDLAPAVTAMRGRTMMAVADAASDTHADTDDDGVMHDLRGFTGIYTEGRFNAPFGAQYASGTAAVNNGPWTSEFPWQPGDDGDVGTPLPLPGTGWLVLLGLWAVQRSAVQRVAAAA